MTGVAIDVDTNAQTAQQQLEGINKSLIKMISNASRVNGSFSGKGTADAAKGFNTAATAARDFDASATKALRNVSTSATATNAGLSSLKTTVVSLAAAFASVAAVRFLNGAADSLTDVQNKLALTVKGTNALVKAQRELRDISTETRSNLGATASVYASFASSLERYGVGAARINRLAATINRAGALSGSSDDSIKAALVQLGQGLSSGTLRGEELNSVLEQMRYLGQGLASHLKMTTGQLRKFAEEGKLTTQIVVDVLEGMEGKTLRDFEKTAIKFETGLTQAGNAVRYFFGSLNQYAGLSSGLARSLNNVAIWLNEASDRVIDALSLTNARVRTKLNEFRGLAGLLKATDVVIKYNVDISTIYDAYTTVRKLTDKWDSIEATARVAIEADFAENPDTYYKNGVVIGKRVADGAFSAIAAAVNDGDFSSGFLEGQVGNVTLWGDAMTSVLEGLRGYVARVVPTIYLPFRTAFTETRIWLVSSVLNFQSAYRTMMYGMRTDTANLFDYIGGFLLDDTRMERAWVALFNSESLAEAAGYVERIGSLIATRRKDDWGYLFKEMYVGAAATLKPVQRALMWLGLVDQQLIDLSDWNSGRLVEGLQTIGRVAYAVYEQVLVPKLKPILYTFGYIAKNLAQRLADSLQVSLEGIDGMAIGRAFAKVFVEISRGVGGALQAVLGSIFSMEEGTGFFKALIAYVVSAVAQVLRIIGGMIAGFVFEIAVTLGLDVSGVKKQFTRLNTFFKNALSFDDVQDGIDQVAESVETLTDRLDAGLGFDFFEEMLDKIVGYAPAALRGALVTILQFVARVDAAFFGLYDAVVGHSYWPDLVDGVNAYTGRLFESEDRITQFADRVEDAFTRLLVTIRRLFVEFREDPSAFVRSAFQSSVDAMSRLTERLADALPSSSGELLNDLERQIDASKRRLEDLRATAASFSIAPMGLLQRDGQATAFFEDLGMRLRDVIKGLASDTSTVLGRAMGLIDDGIDKLLTADWKAVVSDMVLGAASGMAIGMLFGATENGLLKLAIGAYFLGALAPALQSLAVISGPMFGEAIGSIGGHIGSALAEGLLQAVQIGIVALPAMVEGFLNNFGVVGEVIQSVANVTAVLHSKLLMTTLAVLGLMKLFGGGMFNTFLHGQGDQRNGAFSYLASPFKPITDFVSKGSDGLSSMVASPGLLAAGIGALSLAFTDAYSLFDSAVVGVPLLLWAFLGKDGGGTAIRAIAGQLSTVGWLFKFARVGISKAFGADNLLESLLAPGPRRKSALRKSFDGLAGDLVQGFRNMKANGDLYAAGAMGLKDTFLRKDVTQGAGFATYDTLDLKGKLKTFLKELNNSLGGGMLDSIYQGWTALTNWMPKTFSEGWQRSLAALSDVWARFVLFVRNSNIGAVMLSGIDGLWKILSNRYVLLVALMAGFTGFANAADSAVDSVTSSVTSLSVSLIGLVATIGLARLGWQKFQMARESKMLRTIEAMNRLFKSRGIQLEMPELRNMARKRATQDVFKDMWATVSKGASATGGFLGDLGGSLLSGNFKQAFDVIKKAFERLGDALGFDWDAIVNGFAGITDAATSLGARLARLRTALRTALAPLRLLGKLLLIPLAIGAVGALGVALFGEGSSFTDKLQWTFDKVKALVGMGEMTSQIGRADAIADKVRGIVIGDQSFDLSKGLYNIDFKKMGASTFKAFEELADGVAKTAEEINKQFLKTGYVTAADMREFETQRAKFESFTSRQDMLEQKSDERVKYRNEVDTTKLDGSFFRYLFKLQPKMADDNYSDIVRGGKSTLSVLFDLVVGALKVLAAGVLGIVATAIAVTFGGVALAIPALITGFLASLYWLFEDTIKEWEWPGKVVDKVAAFGEDIADFSRDAANFVFGPIMDSMAEADKYARSFVPESVLAAEDQRATLRSRYEPLANDMDPGVLDSIYALEDELTTVTKRIAELSSRGYGEEYSSKGYQLQLDRDMLSASELQQQLERTVSGAILTAEKNRDRAAMNTQFGEIAANAKLFLDVDLGEGGKNFLGRQEQADLLQQQLLKVADAQREVDETWNPFEKAKATAALNKEIAETKAYLEDIQKTFTVGGLADTLSAFFGNNASRNAIDSTVVYDQAAAQNLRQSLLTLNQLQGQFAAAQAIGMPTATVSAFEATESQRRNLMASAPIEVSFGNFQQQLQALGVEGFNEVTFEADGEKYVTLLKEIQTEQADLLFAVRTNQAIPVQVAAMKELKAAIDAVKASVATTNIAALQSALSGQGYSRTFGVAEQAGVEVPTAVLETGRDQRWTELVVKGKELDAKIADLTAKLELGPHIADSLAKAKLEQTANAREIERISQYGPTLDDVGSLISEAGYSYNTQAIRALGASQRDRLVAIAESVAQIDDESSRATGDAARMQLQKRRAAQIAEVRAIYSGVAYATGAGLSELLSASGVDENVFGKLSKTSQETILKLQEEINNLQYAAENSDRGSAMAIREKIALRQKEIEKLSTQVSLQDKLTNINDVFGTSFNVLDLPFLEQSFGDMSEFAEKFAKDMQTALDKKDPVNETFKKGLDAVRLGGLISFSVELSKAVFSGLQKGFNDGLSAVEGMFGGVSDIIYARSGYQASAAPDKFTELMNRTDLTKEMADALNNAGETGIEKAVQLASAAGRNGPKDGDAVGAGRVGIGAVGALKLDALDRRQDFLNGIKNPLEGLKVRVSEDVRDLANIEELTKLAHMSNKEATLKRAKANLEIAGKSTHAIETSLINVQRGMQLYQDGVEKAATRFFDAGVAFAQRITETFTNSLKDFLTAKEESGTAVLESMVGSFADSVIDTFIDGFVNSIMGDNSWIMDKIRTLGAGIFNLGESFGNLSPEQTMANASMAFQTSTMTFEHAVQNFVTAQTGRKFGPGPKGVDLDPLADKTGEVGETIEDTSGSLGSVFTNAFDQYGTQIMNGLMGLGGAIMMMTSASGVGKINWFGMALGAISTGLSVYNAMGSMSSTTNLGTANSSYNPAGMTGSHSIPIKRAKGGIVTGPGHGTSDSILAFLSNKEYVVNAAATRENLGLLNAINYGGKFAQGGLVGGSMSMPSSVDLSRDASNRSKNETHVHINVTGDISRQTRSEIQKMLPSIAQGVNQHNRERGDR